MELWAFGRLWLKRARGEREAGQFTNARSACTAEEELEGTARGRTSSAEGKTAKEKLPRGECQAVLLTQQCQKSSRVRLFRSRLAQRLTNAQ